MKLRNKIVVTVGACAMVALAVVLTGCTSPRRAQIYPHGDSTAELPVYVLLVSKGGITKKDITFSPPLYEEYFKLVGKKSVYATGEFSWLMATRRDPPQGKITVDWITRHVVVDTLGTHLYDGDYTDVLISPEILK